MVLATAVWEMRADGDNTNGGGFDAGIAGAGTDYSQQVDAELSLTDLAMVTGGTTITSATGGFTSAMIGNCINIASGTNFTAGRYFIEAVADTNTATIDEDATNGSNATAGVAKVGGCLAMFTVVIAQTIVAGNTVWIKKGTYTATETFTVSDGTTSARVKLKVYTTTRGDSVDITGDAIFNMGAYRFIYGLYTELHYISVTGTDGNLFGPRAISSYAILKNCKAINTSDTANRAAFFGRNTFYFGCIASSTLGRAFLEAFYMNGCIAYDSSRGVFSNQQRHYTINCVIDTCTTGISSANESITNGNTIYNCTTGVDLDNRASQIISLNIITNCTTGILTSTGSNGECLINNCLNNTTNYSNVGAGIDDIIADPLLTDPENKDFTLQAGSPALNTGFDYTIIGLTGDYKWNIGIDQDNQTSGGSSSLGGFVFVV